MAKKWGLCRIEFSGIIRIATSRIFPGFAGTPARLHWRVSCFWGFDSSVHQTERESPDSARVALFACQVNAMFQMIVK